MMRRQLSRVFSESCHRVGVHDLGDLDVEAFAAQHGAPDITVGHRADEVSVVSTTRAICIAPLSMASPCLLHRGPGPMMMSRQFLLMPVRQSRQERRHHASSE